MSQFKFRFRPKNTLGQLWTKHLVRTTARNRKINETKVARQ